MPNDRYTLNISYGNEKTGELKFALSQQPEISIKSSGKYIDPFEDIQSKKNQKASAAAKEKDFYITPRIGFSTLTGLIGIELQYKHFAFDLGYYFSEEPEEEGEYNHFLTYGIKYYFKPHRSTWYFGLGAVTNLDEGELGIGFLFGYRWRWGKGWDFNLGIGAGFPIGKDGSTFPMFDLAFGYSF